VQREFQLSDGTVALRLWRRSDKDALLRHANNHRVWINLKDGSPHPYTESDADAWLARCAHTPDNRMHSDFGGRAGRRRRRNNHRILNLSTDYV
jgi:hypothetical protein